MHHLDSWIKIDCFIISLFTAQHVSNVSTSIFRSLRLIVDCCIAVVRRVLVLRCGSAGVVWYPYAGWSPDSPFSHPQNVRKALSFQKEGRSSSVLSCSHKKHKEIPFHILTVLQEKQEIRIKPKPCHLFRVTAVEYIQYVKVWENPFTLWRCPLLRLVNIDSRSIKY